MLFEEPLRNDKVRIFGYTAFNQVLTPYQALSYVLKRRLGPFSVFNGSWRVYLTRTKRFISTKRTALNERTFPLERKSQVAYIDEKHAEEKVFGKVVLRNKFIPNRELTVFFSMKKNVQQEAKKFKIVYGTLTALKLRRDPVYQRRKWNVCWKMSSRMKF